MLFPTTLVLLGAAVVDGMSLASPSTRSTETRMQSVATHEGLRLPSTLNDYTETRDAVPKDGIYTMWKRFNDRGAKQERRERALLQRSHSRTIVPQPLVDKFKEPKPSETAKPMIVVIPFGTPWGIADAIVGVYEHIAPTLSTMSKDQILNSTYPSNSTSDRQPGHSRPSTTVSVSRSGSWRAEKPRLNPTLAGHFTGGWRPAMFRPHEVNSDREHETTGTPTVAAVTAQHKARGVEESTSEHDAMSSECVVERDEWVVESRPHVRHTNTTTECLRPDCSIVGKEGPDECP